MPYLLLFIVLKTTIYTLISTYDSEQQAKGYFEASNTWQHLSDASAQLTAKPRIATRHVGCRPVGYPTG